MTESLDAPIEEEPFQDVTYESLGIDPESFYAGRFGYPNRLAAFAARFDKLRSPGSKFDIRSARLRFLTEHLSGGRVLDLGCGSGFLGATLKQQCGLDELVGVDFDPACVRQAQKTYDRAEAVDLNQPLPFPDDCFDAVVSLDLFGHIEFRHKNGLVREVHRVTKPGGLSLHAIESNNVDYHSIDADDPDDPLLQYILMEGHVGIESARRLKLRWERWFSPVTVENAFVYPLIPIPLHLAGPDGLDPQLVSIMSSFGAKERRAAHIVLGFVSDYMKSMAREIDSDLLTPLDAPATNSPEALLVSRLFQRASGLVFLRAVADAARRTEIRNR